MPMFTSAFMRYAVLDDVRAVQHRCIHHLSSVKRDKGIDVDRMAITDVLVNRLLLNLFCSNVPAHCIPQNLVDDVNQTLDLLATLRFRNRLSPGAEHDLDETLMELIVRVKQLGQP